MAGLTRPIDLVPNTRSSIRAVDVSNSVEFSAKVPSAIDAYSVQFRRVSNNAVIHNIEKTSVTVEKGERLRFTVPGSSPLTNGLKVKWVLTIFNGSDSISSIETVFQTADTPNVGLTVPSTVTTQQLVITPTYSQSQDIDWRSFQVRVFDEHGEERTQLSSNVITTGALSYTIQGLVDGTTDMVRVDFVAENGLTASTPTRVFSVNYNAPNINAEVTATVDRLTSGVTTTIPDNLYVLNANESIQGTFVSNFPVSGQSGYRLAGGQMNSWTPSVGIPSTFQADIYPIEFDTTNPGRIMLDNEYYISNNTSEIFSVIQGTRSVLYSGTLTNKRFHLIIRATTVVVREVT